MSGNACEEQFTLYMRPLSIPNSLGSAMADKISQVLVPSLHMVWFVQCCDLQHVLNVPWQNLDPLVYHSIADDFMHVRSTSLLGWFGGCRTTDGADATRAD